MTNKKLFACLCMLAIQSQITIASESKNLDALRQRSLINQKKHRATMRRLAQQDPLLSRATEEDPLDISYRSGQPRSARQTANLNSGIQDNYVSNRMNEYPSPSTTNITHELPPIRYIGKVEW